MQPFPRMEVAGVGEDGICSETGLLLFPGLGMTQVRIVFKGSAIMPASTHAFPLLRTSKISMMESRV